MPNMRMTAARAMTDIEICEFLGPLIKAKINEFCNTHPINMDQLADSLNINRGTFYNLKTKAGYGTVLKILDDTQGIDLVELIERASDSATQSEALREFFAHPLAQMRITSAEKIALLALDILGVFSGKTPADIETVWQKVVLKEDGLFASK